MALFMLASLGIVFERFWNGFGKDSERIGTRIATDSQRIMTRSATNLNRTWEGFGTALEPPWHGFELDLGIDLQRIWIEFAADFK